MFTIFDYGLDWKYLELYLILTMNVLTLLFVLINLKQMDPSNISESPLIHKALPSIVDPAEVCDLRSAVASQGQLLGIHA